MAEHAGPPRCCASRWDTYGKHECPNRSKVERDGKGYCGVHDPVAVKRRIDVRVANYRARAEESDERYRRIFAEHAACQGVATDDLRPGLVAELLAIQRENPS